MRTHGFTLAELLVALLILGVIATFSIPKVLLVQQNQRYKAVTKEAAAAISQAYYAYKLTNTITSNTSLDDIVSSLNYVQRDTSDWMDADPTNGVGFIPCSSFRCYKLASGAMVMWSDTGGKLGGTAANNAMWFYVDPNASQYEPSLDAQAFWLYYNGRLTTHGSAVNPTCNSDGCWPPDAANETTWFNWD